MSDWVGLGLILLVFAGALAGLSHLGRRPKPLTAEEYERRVAEARGTTRGAALAAANAMNRLINPKAAEAIEVQRDLRAGFYDDGEQKGEGDVPGRVGAGTRPSDAKAGLTEGEGDDA